MSHARWISAASTTTGGGASLAPGSTGVRFYTDRAALVEVFPVNAWIATIGDELTTPIDVNALKNGTLDLSNLPVTVEFSVPVDINSVRVLGNPVFSVPAKPFSWGWWESTASVVLGYGPVIKEVSGSIVYYDIWGLGLAVDFPIIVNFNAPTLAQSLPYLVVTGESVTGGVPGLPFTYQWYSWNGSSWVSIAGAATMDMPQLWSGGAFNGGTTNYLQSGGLAIIGNQFKLVASQITPSGTITGEKIWSITGNLLYINPATVYGIVNTPSTIYPSIGGGDGTYVSSWTASGASPSSGTSLNPTVTWSTTGTKTVSQTITSAGQTITVNHTVYVGTPPITATITATPTTGTINQNFTFAVSNVAGGASPGSYTYNWSGPDGITETGTSVSKIFSSEGTKTVTCVITSGGFSNTFTVNAIVTLPAITGSIIANPTTGNIGDNITYSVSGISGGSGIYTYAWSGSDSLTGTTSSVAKSYTTTGTKTATCVITSGSVSLTLNTSAEIGILPITGSITADPISVVLGSPINFTMNAIGGVGSFVYNWTGDESFIGTTQTVTKTFSSIGTKNVTCAVTSGGVTTNFTTQITVTALPSLTVSILPNVTRQLPNANVVFTSTVSGGTGVYTYLWTATDGLTSTLANPTFQWTTLGTKTVSLTVTSGTQNVTVSTDVIIVSSLTTNLGRLCFVG